MWSFWPLVTQRRLFFPINASLFRVVCWSTGGSSSADTQEADTPLLLSVPTLTNQAAQTEGRSRLGHERGTSFPVCSIFFFPAYHQKICQGQVSLTRDGGGWAETHTGAHLIHEQIKGSLNSLIHFKAAGLEKNEQKCPAQRETLPAVSSRAAAHSQIDLTVCPLFPWLRSHCDSDCSILIFSVKLGHYVRLDHYNIIIPRGDLTSETRQTAPFACVLPSGGWTQRLTSENTRKHTNSWISVSRCNNNKKTIMVTFPRLHIFTSQHHRSAMLTRRSEEQSELLLVNI